MALDRAGFVHSSDGTTSHWVGRKERLRVGRMGARVFLPPGVSLIDDPGAKEAHGTALLGYYAVDDEGRTRGEVTIVDNGNA